MIPSSSQHQTTEKCNFIVKATQLWMISKSWMIISISYQPTSIIIDWSDLLLLSAGVTLWNCLCKSVKQSPAVLRETKQCTMSSKVILISNLWKHKSGFRPSCCCTFYSNFYTRIYLFWWCIRKWLECLHLKETDVILFSVSST